MAFSAIDHPNRVGITAPSSDSSNRLATTAFVQGAIAGGTAGSVAPEATQISSVYTVGLADHLHLIEPSSVAPTVTLSSSSPGGTTVFFWAVNSNLTLVPASTGHFIFSMSLGVSSQVTVASSTLRLFFAINDGAGDWVLSF